MTRLRTCGASARQAAPRHRWGEPLRFAHKTERACARPGCPIVKVTRHEPGVRPWQEFWRQADGGATRIAGAGTPPCAGDERTAERAA